VVAAYQAVLELDAENVQAQTGLCDACIALGDTLQEAGDIAGAMECYRQVLDIYAEHTEAQERLADLDRVATVQRQLARSRERQELDDWYAEARYALSEGDHGKAAGFLHKVVDRDPEYRDAKQLLARAEAVVGKRKQRRGLRQLITGVGVTGAVVGLVVVACLAVFIVWGLVNGWAPLIQTPTPTATPTPTSTPTSTPTATPTPTPTDTPIPTDEPTPTSTATLIPTEPPVEAGFDEESLGDGWVRYTHPVAGYSIELPESWMVFDMTNEREEQLVLDRAGLDPTTRSILESDLVDSLLYTEGMAIAAYIVKFPAVEGQDAEYYLGSMELQFESMEGAEIVESGTVVVDGVEAARLVIDSTVTDMYSREAKVRFVLVIVPHEDGVYMIMVTTEAEQYAEYEGSIERMIYSLRVIEG